MKRRVLVGVVVSNKPTKTVVVAVERRVRHPLYERVVRSTKRYHAHDETNAIPEGARVRIEERRPLSRLKRWEVIEVLAGMAEDGHGSDG
ncbi:MAG: 30S ribosomal protein S17 [Armatimonadetes bacterium]|nr:30S ribosomal protein S17 [Armatimonadota bacterium]